MNKPRIPLDYAKSLGRVPRAERRGERCSNLIFCAALFSFCGVVLGSIATMLYMAQGGC